MERVNAALEALDLGTNSPRSHNHSGQVVWDFKKAEFNMIVGPRDDKVSIK